MHQRIAHRSLPRLLIIGALSLLAGCVAEVDPTSSSSSVNSQADSSSSTSNAPISSISSSSDSLSSTSTAANSDAYSRGKALFDSAEMNCHFCHGRDGKGGVTNKPVTVGACKKPEAGGCENIAVLATYIAGNMPDTSGKCVDSGSATCATDIATYMVTAFNPDTNISDGDADNDGIPDELDRCPGTDEGKTVGATGCAPKDENDLPAASNLTSPQLRLTADQYANTIKTAFGQDSLPNVTYMSDIFGPFEIFANNAKGTAASKDFSTILEGARVLGAAIAKDFSNKCSDDAWRNTPQQCVNNHFSAALKALYRVDSLDNNDAAAIAGVIKTNIDLGATPEEAVATGITLALIDDRAIFKIEHGTNASATGKQQLSAREFINRLSYMLVANTPDQALVNAASGLMSNDNTVTQHAERLTEDALHKDVMWKFVAEWLNIKTALPDESVALVPTPFMGDQCNNTNQCKTKYPGLAQNYDCANSASANSVCMCGNTRCDSLTDNTTMTLSVADSAQLETRKFIDYMVDNNLPFSELFSANYSFINKTLAEHYGVPAPAADWELYTFPADANRQGILTHASFLSSNGNHGRDLNTIFRGKVVFERLFCEKMPVPENANELFELADQIPDRTVDPRCSFCHNVVDPIGRIFDLYNDNGGLFDSQELFGELKMSVDIANTYDSVSELSSAIAGSESMVHCATRQLFRSSLGRDITVDESESFAKVRDALSGGTLSGAMSALAATDAFKHVYTNFNSAQECSMGN